MVELVIYEGRRFNVTDVPSLDRRNIERHPDGSLVSTDHNLAWATPGRDHLAPESCGDLCLIRGYIISYGTRTY